MTSRAAWLMVARLVIAGVLFTALALVGGLLPDKLVTGQPTTPTLPTGEPGPVTTGEAPSLVLTLTATALVLAVLWLLRPRIEAFADRRTYGRDAARHREVQALLTQMAASVPVDEVIPNLAQTLSRRVHSVRTEVRLSIADGELWREVWPPPSDTSATGERLTVQVNHGGVEVAEIDVDTEQGGATDRRLLDSIAGPAGLALSTVRLTYALRRRAAELAQLNDQLARSRARLLTVRQQEWSRFRAELDLRVLPQLAAATTSVERAASAVRDGGSAPALDEPAHQLSSALDALRAIARGIYPPRLATDGLLTSLRSWRNGALEVQITDEGAFDALRDVPAVEASAYFALVTWADAAEAVGPVRVEVVGDELWFTATAFVADPEPILLAIGDRLDAFGGSLEAERTTGSPPGMMITGRLPLTAAPDTDPSEER